MTDGLRGVKLHLVESLEDVAALASWLGERRPRHAIAVDTETEGLVVGRDRVRLAQVGDGAHGWAIPAEGGRNLLGLLRDILARWDGQILMHNAKFDVGMLAAAGVEVPLERVLDTRIVAHILEPHLPSALKSVAVRHVDGGSAALQDQLKGTSYTWANVPLDYGPYWSYAGLDTVLTYRVYDRLWPRIEADGLTETFDMENAVQWVLYRMERYGAHIDTARAAQALDQFRVHADAVAAWCKENYGCQPGSNASVARRLIADGAQLDQLTPTGAIQLDREALSSCLDHPLAQAVLEHRKITKLASTYLAHLATETDNDHLIHPSINILGARTGRMSMERPNLQNLPRRSEGDTAANVVRECFTPRADDRVMMMCDFDQVEMRVMTDFAQEPAMTAAFRNASVDFFVALARLVYQDPSIEKSDRRRQVVKNAGYAQIYGAGVDKFSATAGIPVEQGRWVRSRWDELYPTTAAFARRIIDLGVQRRYESGLAYVRCPISGRIRVADAGKEYALVNYLIQGLAAHLFKRKLIELEHAGLGPWMVAPVHDEIVLDVPTERVDEVADVLLKVMNDDGQLLVPLTASVSVGANWGAKEDYRAPVRG